MKKLSLILNAVIAVAVIVLYVLFFTSKSCKSTKVETTSAVNDTTSGGIVYVNIDTVYSKYDMYKDVAGDLEQKTNTARAQLDSKQRKFESDYKDYMNKINKGLITHTEAAQIEQDLQKQQQDFQSLQNDLQYKLSEEQQVARNKVLNSIMDYLKNMQDAGKYKFIFGNSFGDNILYSNKHLDITKEVIEGLNTEYKLKQDKEK